MDLKKCKEVVYTRLQSKIASRVCKNSVTMCDTFRILVLKKYMLSTTNDRYSIKLLGDREGAMV